MQFVPIIKAHRGFVYGAILSKPFQDGIGQRVTGTTGSRQRAQPKSVAEIPVVRPTKDLIDSYSEICSNLIENKTKNIKQNKSLAAIRDALLPKLLSGEIALASHDRRKVG